MAIVKSLWLRGASQRLGGVVLYSRLGETLARELAPAVTNPRTSAQMTQRVKWANLVNFYRANKSWMQRAYETKPNNNSDYNRFMSLNVTNSRIYLTKAQANAGSTIVDAYKVTEGSLDSVEITPSGDNWLTNIFTGNLAAIDANTTVGAFSAALISANPAILEGDQLSFIRITQMTNANTGNPYIIVRKYEVLIKSASTALLSEYLPIDYFGITAADSNNVLQVVNSGLAGGFTLILSRTTGGTIRVSSQEIVVANNQALISAYSSDAQRQLAADSYGETTEVFLSSASANVLGGQVVPLAPLSFSDGTDTYVSGDFAGRLEDFAEAGGEILFNQDIGGTSAEVVIGYYEDGTLNDTTTWGTVTGTITGNKITFTFPVQGERSGYLSEFNITIDGVHYWMHFANSGDGNGEGLT